LGFKIIQENRKLSIGQRRIVQKLEKLNAKFNDSNQWGSPSSPTFFLVRPKTKTRMIGEEQQKRFRLTIGTLLYLVKLSRPDIVNPVRELSKVMDGTTPAHEKELKRLKKIIIQTKEKRLNIKPTKDP
jgi:hypothetical protein